MVLMLLSIHANAKYAEEEWEKNLMMSKFNQMTKAEYTALSASWELNNTTDESEKKILLSTIKNCIRDFPCIAKIWSSLAKYQ